MTESSVSKILRPNGCATGFDLKQVIVSTGILSFSINSSALLSIFSLQTAPPERAFIIIFTNSFKKTGVLNPAYGNENLR